MSLKPAALIMALALGAAAFAASPTYAADKGGLGGDCCSDLEERVADLEATAAKHGNRKLTLTISGLIDADYTYVSLNGYHDGRISQNGNNPSFVRFSGAAKLSPDLAAGYTVEIDIAQLGLLNTPLQSSNQPTARQSYWWIKSEKLGTVSVGLQAQATNFFNNPDGFSTNSAWLAGKPLSFGSLSDLYLTGVDLPFDGGYRNSVKYVSPELMGFTLSASWGASVDAFSTNGTGDTYDVALRYDSKQNLGDFHVKGAVGYRRSTDFPVNLVNIVTLNIPTGDVDTVSVLGSVLHAPTGIFLNGEFVNQDWKQANFTLKGYDLTGGVHEMLMPQLGATEFFGTWGRVSVEPVGMTTTDIDYYGLGATQALDAAAMTLYLGWRHYNTTDVLGTDVDAVNAGAIVRF